MSLKPIWKNRAIARAAEPKPDWGPSPVEGFRPLSFEEIRNKMAEEFKKHLPGAAPAIDDPTSNIGQMINAIAAADVDLYKQVEATIKFIEEKGVKFK